MKKQTKDQTKSTQNIDNWKDTWSFWFFDKFIIAILIIAITAGFNVWAENKKAVNVAKVADTTLAVEKAGELWSTAGELKASLERINRLKMGKCIYKDKDPKIEQINKDIDTESKKSKELEVKLDSLIHKQEYYIGKPLAEHTARYAQLLKGYYSMKDNLMFSNWPKQIDLTPQFKSLEEMGNALYKMEIDFSSMRTIALQQHDR